MSDTGREGAMIENIRRTVSENLGIDGDILKAVVVRCANPDNQVDRSRVNELIYDKEVPRAHLGKGHIGI
jgi:hypothetical protein